MDLAGALWLTISLANQEISDYHYCFLVFVKLSILGVWDVDVDFTPVLIKYLYLFARELLHRFNGSAHFIALSLTVHGENGRVMRHRLREKAEIFGYQLIGFAEEWVERFT